MVVRQNFKELKQALEAYCSAPTHDHPFIIAGWPGIGKTALVEEVREKYPELTSKDYNLEEAVDATQLQIIEDWSKHPGGPKVICITCGVNLAPLRDVMLAGCDIHIMELDINCWLEWAKSKQSGGFVSNVDPIMISLIEKNPSLLHSNIAVRENALEQIDQYLVQLENDDTLNFKVTSYNINELFILLQMLYLTRTEVKPPFDRMMNSFFIMREKADDDFNVSLLRKVMLLGELHAKQFI